MLSHRISSKHEVRGILVPLLTALTPDDEVDVSALRAHVEWLIEKGVHGT